MLITIDAATLATFIITIIFMVVIICSLYFLYFLKEEKDRIGRTLYILMISIILGGSSLVLLEIWRIVIFK